MTYCLCCIYGQIIETGRYKCINQSSLLEYGEEQADVSSCVDYIYDDSFDEDDEYPECYLKEICVDKNCERFS